MRDNEKSVYKNLDKFQKWDNELFSNVCNNVKKFVFLNIGIYDALVCAGAIVLNADFF